MTFLQTPAVIRTETAELSIADIHCCECAWVLQLALEAVHGVRHADVDPDDGSTSIVYEPEAVSLESLIEGIRFAGYDVEPKRMSLVGAA